MRHLPLQAVRATLLAAAWVVIAGSLAGCSEGTTLVPEPAIKAVQTSALTVPRGFAATTVVVVDRRDSYTADITLVAQTVPTGLTVSFSPATLTGSEETAQVTVSAPLSVQPGTYTFTIRASGIGVDARTSTMTVEVAEPSFSMSVNTQLAQVEQGATVNVPITVGRSGGYNYPIDLSISGVPSEMSGTITPSRLQPGQTTAVLKLTASYLATTATATLTVRGQAVGLPQQTATLPLAVVPATTPAIYVITAPMVETVRGAVRTHTVNVLRFGGFTGEVSFQVVGAPAGIVITAPTLQVGEQTATLSFNVPVSVPQSVYPAVLRASGASIASFDVPITIRTSTTFAFSYGFQDVPPQQSLNPVYTVARGATVELALRTLRAVETEIRLTAHNVPANVTLSMPEVLPATPAEQLTTFSLAVAPGTPPGQLTFMIRLLSETTGYERLSNVTLIVQ